MTRYIFLLLPAALFLSSCSGTRTVTVPVMRPAPLHVGNHIQKVALIDRVAPDRTILGTVETFLTGSTPGQDREAAQRAIDGLLVNLQRSPRFEVVRTAESLTARSSRGSWPEPLTWELVSELCETYDSDAVISLESFNSDFIVTNGQREVRPSRRSNQEPGATEYFAEGVATLKLGFRLYDPSNKSIVDAHMFDHSATWSATGTSIRDAVAQLIDHRRAVVNTSYESGRIYALRIAPQWTTARREFFRSGGDTDFKIGVRRATVNDWDGATEAWYRSVRSGDPKTAGRSAFNLALMYEIAGDLSTAQEWARTAYVDYGISRARSYVHVLERRITDQQRTDAQLR